MAKLNKTQIELLTDADRNSYGRVSVSSGHYAGRKPSFFGGKNTYGTRKRDAAIALIKAGMLTLIARHSGSYVLANRTTTDYSTETTYEITSAGREALYAATK